jgi:hypothetical protein
MSEIKSQSDMSSHQVRNFFVPSGAERTLYILLGIIFNTVLNSGSIISKLSNNYISSPQTLKANFSTLVDGVSKSFSTALDGRLGQILLWSFIGAVAYLSIWAFKNLLNSFENDVIVNHYLHPSSYGRTGYWGSSIAVKIFLLALILIFGVFGFVCVAAVLPALAALSGSALYKFVITTSPFYILFATLGTAVIFYLLAMMLRLIAHLWKLL